MQQKKSISGKTGWRSPSNIALIKYWGKKGLQLPANPSLSFTLSNCSTTTSCQFVFDEKYSGIDLHYSFNQKHDKAVEQKVLHYLQSIREYMPFLDHLNLKIESSNNFPHAAGIASSASSMSALALCLCSIEEKLNNQILAGKEFFQRASFLARLASGSACRSVYGGFALWGSCKVEGSHDEYAIAFPLRENNIFNTLQDTILVIDSNEKQVSSRAGHKLMNAHPFAENRYEQANENLSKLIHALHNQEIEDFISVVESEALSLHAMMLTSSNPFILIKPNTLAIIEEIRDFREKTSLPVCFTLDAGPNVHLIYPYQHKNVVNEFVASKLLVNCARNFRIQDQIGQGSEKLTTL